MNEEERAGEEVGAKGETLELLSDVFHIIELSRMELRVLDVSENELGELPYDLRHMCSLIELHLRGNPLTTPPATICSKASQFISMPHF